MGVPLVLMCPPGVLDCHWGTVGSVRRGSVIGHCGGLLLQREARRVQNLQPHQRVTGKHVDTLKLGQMKTRPPIQQQNNSQ